MWGSIYGGGGDTLNVTGTLTNAAGATLYLYDGSNDVASIGTLSNSGSVYIGTGATLNLTNQPNGITDVVAGSSLTVNGTFTAGSASGLAKLGSIEGTLTLGNGQTTADTPGSGTLTVASGGALTLNNSGTTLSVTGTLNDAGTVTVNSGTTLNATQSMTDLPASGTFQLNGNTNALAKLTSVEGLLYLLNGQTTSVTPNGGTLTLNSGSAEYIGTASGLTVNGNLTNNSTSFYMGYAYGGGNTLTVTGGFANNGSLYMWGSIYGGGGDTLNVTGTLTNAAGATLYLYDGSNDVANVHALNNSGTIYLGSGTVLNLTAGGTETNNGTINVGSGSGPATLNIKGSVTLSGAGNVILSDNSGNLITASATTDVLTSANTIEGAGNIGNGAMGFVNTGTVIANATTNALNIDVSTAKFNNKGTVEATTTNLNIMGPTGNTTFFTNYNPTSKTLTGGTYIANGGNIGWLGANITTLAANVTEENGGQILNNFNGTGSNALAGLTSITSAGSLTIGGAPAFVDAGTFSNAGSLTILSGQSFGVGSLTQISGGTLTAGTLVLDANLNLSGATENITTNSANVTLAGGTIENANSTDAFANLASNTKFLTLANNANFTTVGNFTNTGTLTINSGSAFTVTGTLAQISGSTLSGGTFVLGGNLNVGSGINITTNSSTLTLDGGTIMSGGTDALAGLNSNTKSLTFAANASFNYGNFSNTGTLTINSGSFVDVTGTLAQFNSATNTLKGGTFVIGGTLDMAAGTNGIETDSSSITLDGAGYINNNTTGLSALANLSTISSTGSLTLASNANFTTGGNFTNSGKLTVNSGSTFAVTGTLTNLGAGTLTGGTYTVGGTMQLASGNGSIITNAANLTLTGTTASILDGASNALSTFNNNTGTFTLSGNANLTTATTSNFNNSGTVVVSKGSTLTVGGSGHSYNQTAGTTTVDGTIAGGGATGVNITGGTMQGVGTLKTNVSLGPGTLNVGDAGKAGLLKITGTYTQLSTGTMNVSIGGTTAGSKYSQLQVSGAASLAGTLTAAEVNGFTPTVGQMFTVLTAHSITGTFSDSTITINGTEHFNVSYTATSVVLTVVSGAASNASNTAASPSPMAVASTKQTVAVAKLPIAISGLRHKIGVPLKVGKPILVSGLSREGRGSNAIIGRVWGLENLRTPHAEPVVSLWNRPSERPAQVSRIASSDSTRANLPVSNNWIARNGVRVSPAPGVIGLSTRRPAMAARMLPTHIPMMTTVR
jgi:hypothetical protein